MIVLQHDGITLTSHVVIAPLTPPLVQIVSRAYPILEVLGMPAMMLTPDLAVVTRNRLLGPIANLADQRGRIIAAIDMLFAGS